ncbi:hypothetical protein ACEPAG_803 [Sanghuangporus baumii]
MPGPRGSDDHVRALLDQRAQRADVPPPPTRMSIFSDRSDSPSLYSHFDNNPYRNTPTTPVPRFNRYNEDHDYHDRHDVYPPLSPKERLADPNASSLDLSEDTDAYSESGSRIVDTEDDSNLVPDEDEDPETRLSLMGPKMRVHSRAPWEEDEGSLSDGDSDIGGNDNASVFSGKKAGLMRGLGFGSKSPAPRPSFDSGMPVKGKHSFETTTNTVASSTSRSAIHALAQASMSSTSLAIGQNPPTGRLPHKLSVGRLALHRDRSASGPASASDTGSYYPPLSPRSAVFTERSSGRNSPASCRPRRDSISPNRSEFTTTSVRTRSPSPIPAHDNDSAYMHPYANPVLLSAYHRSQGKNTFNKEEQDAGHSHVIRNDSVTTLATSEETVTVTHSSSTLSASLTSTSGMETSTPPTSDFSLVSSASRVEILRAEQITHEAEKLKEQKRSKRETKLGPISAPCLVENGGFPTSTPYNLISLEQAQARARERNRSATTSAVSFPTSNVDDNSPHDFTPRARSTSGAGKAKHVLPLLSVDNKKTVMDDMPSPISPAGNKHPSPIGPAGGKVLRPKRSGFMKLFNAREKDKIPEVPPPLPLIGSRAWSQSDDTNSLCTARPPKISTHRVPVPAVVPPPNVNSDDSGSKKTGPSLSIKISSPPSSHASSQMMHTRKSDSPKALHPPTSPRMPSSAPADMTEFQSLKLRPVSAFFSKNFAEHLLAEDQRADSPRNADVASLISPTTVASSDLIPSPVNAGFNIAGIADSSHGDRFTTGENEDQSAIIVALKDQIRASRITWQRQIWELEGQIRDLRAEIDDLKSGDICEVCGRGGSLSQERKVSNTGVLHRPRAKTGHGARFASGNDS